MELLAFVYLLIISVAVALLMVYLPKLPKVEAYSGITTTIIVAYIGARLGAPLFGNWPFLAYQGVSILPAILGAVVAVLLARACAECCKK